MYCFKRESVFLLWINIFQLSVFICPKCMSRIFILIWSRSLCERTWPNFCDKIRSLLSLFIFLFRSFCGHWGCLDNLRCHDEGLYLRGSWLGITKHILEVTHFNYTNSSWWRCCLHPIQILGHFPVPFSHPFVSISLLSSSVDRQSIRYHDHEGALVCLSRRVPFPKVLWSRGGRSQQEFDR